CGTRLALDRPGALLPAGRGLDSPGAARRLLGRALRAGPGAEPARLVGPARAPAAVRGRPGLLGRRLLHVAPPPPRRPGPASGLRGPVRPHTGGGLLAGAAGRRGVAALRPLAFRLACGHPLGVQKVGSTGPWSSGSVTGSRWNPDCTRRSLVPLPESLPLR